MHPAPRRACYLRRPTHAVCTEARMPSASNDAGCMHRPTQGVCTKLKIRFRHVVRAKFKNENMKRNILSVFAKLASTLIMMMSVSCSNTVPGDERIMPGDADIFSFQLSTATQLSVETRAENESAVNDLWVIQLNAGGTEALVPPVYLTSNEFTTTQSGKVEFKVKLKKENSTVYVIANSGDASLFDINAALSTFNKGVIEGKSITSTSDWANTLSNTPPMSVTWNGTPEPAQPIETSLIRAIAYLSISVNKDLPSGNSLSISSIQLKNVPQTLYYVTPSTSTYPDAGTDFMDYPTTTYTSLTYYMPDNRRGTGSGRYETEKTAAAVSNGGKATYVEIKGNYNGKIPVTYCFYLGGDNSKDYNVRRNTKYTIGITIKGMNKNDARLTIEVDELSITSSDNISWTGDSNEDVNGSANK